jgi:hypothetical protein
MTASEGGEEPTCRSGFKQKLRAEVITAEGARCGEPERSRDSVVRSRTPWWTVALCAGRDHVPKADAVRAGSRVQGRTEGRRFVRKPARHVGSCDHAVPNIDASEHDDDAMDQRPRRGSPVRS